MFRYQRVIRILVLTVFTNLSLVFICFCVSRSGLHCSAYGDSVDNTVEKNSNISLNPDAQVAISKGMQSVKLH